MTQVTGNLIHILNEPSQVAEVRVAVQEDRPAGTGIALDDTPKATYDRQTGVVAFDAIPGPAMLLLKWVGETTSKQFSMIIPDTGPATLADCVRNAEMAGDRDVGELAGILEQIRGSVGASAEARAGAEAAAVDAAGSAVSAGRDAARAEAAAGEAATEAAGLAADAVRLEVKGDADRSAAGATTATEKAAEAAGSATRAETAEAGAVTARTGAEEGQELSEDAAAVAVAAAVGAAAAVADQQVDVYGGYIAPSVSLDTVLAGGKDTYTRSYYNAGAGSDRPAGASGLLEVTNTGPMFTQVFYGSSQVGIWQRRLTDRTHIVPDQWIITEWVQVDRDERFTDFLETQNAIIPYGTDWDTLTEPRTWAASSSNRGYTNAPVEHPIGTLVVSDVRNSSGNIQSQLFLEYQPAQLWLRYRQTSGAWGPWQALGMDGTDRIQAGSARREAVVEAGLKRRGGVVGTGGKPAIALRFDHHLIPFGEKVLPLLKQHRLPWGQMINANNIGKGNDAWTWGQLATECHASGGEVWNHAYTHNNVVNAYQADVAVTLGLSALRDNLPSLWVDSWAPPGQTEYMGFVNQDSPEKFFDTYPGKLVLAQHAFIRGSYPGPHHPLAGSNLIGQGHVTIDKQTAAWCQAAVRSARDTGSGLTMMLHSNYLDQSGYMTTSELSQVLAYIAQLRDAGEIVVLSNAGILMADASVPVRQTNMLANAGAGEVTSSWSQQVTSRSYLAHLGVPHEAEAWVAGSGEASLAVDVSSPTHPVTVEHTVTLTEGTPQRLSVLVTPPMDTTGITVTLTGDVRHTGIIYRPI